MDMVERAIRSLQQLNEALHSEGDSARARYVSVEPDYDFDGEWIVFVTWEIEPPNGDKWPLRMLDEYSLRSREAIGDAAGDAASTHCLFRTPEEISEPGHQRGEQLQPA